MPSNLTAVPPDRQCGAKTRAGIPCKNWGIPPRGRQPSRTWPSGRCRMHGGKSYSGYASPSLKQWWYSKAFPFWVFRLQVEAEEAAKKWLETRLAELRHQR